MQLANLVALKEKIGTKERSWYFKLEGYPDLNAVKVTVSYDLGGMNYFSGEQRRRGYYAYVIPMTISERDSGFGVESHTLFGKNSGGCMLIEPATRYSQKTYEKLLASGDAERVANQAWNIVRSKMVVEATA